MLRNIFWNFVVWKYDVILCFIFERLDCMYENKIFFLYIFFCYISEKTGHFNTRFYIFIVQKYQPILTRMVEKYARKSQIFWKDFENFMKFPLLIFLIYIYIIIIDWVRVQPNYMGWAQPDEAKPSPKRRWAMTDPKKKRHRATMSL
jgi:hypothetical protein